MAVVATGMTQVVTLPSQTLTIPFIYFLRPPPEYELLLPAFQDIWNSLPFVSSRSVETDPSAVSAVQSWMAYSQGRAQGNDPNTAPLPAVTWDIIRLMAAAPLYTNELLVDDRHILSIRDRARVTNKVRSVPFVSGRFFSEAWLFRTWSDDIVAAVLTGVSVGHGVWRGRLEFRCNNGHTFTKYIKEEETSRPFTRFLTNGIFYQQSEPQNDVFDPEYREEGQWALGSQQFLLTKWQVVVNSRKMLGLCFDPDTATTPRGLASVS